MNFSQALEAIKKNEQVARKGWNGKSMFIFLIDPYLTDQFRVIESPTMVGTLLPYIAMKTADNKLVPWLASQTDILAEDWVVVNE
jgi:hypothetical protein